MIRVKRIVLINAMIACCLWLPATYCLGSGLIEPTRTLEGEKPKPAKLSIFSEPPGLKVLLDGKAVGITPVHLEVVGQGSHDLQVEGRETAIIIAPGEVRRLSFFKGEFIDFPVEEDKPREEPKAAPEKSTQQAGAEQAADKNEELEPGFFPLNPRGPIY